MPSRQQFGRQLHEFASQMLSLPAPAKHVRGVCFVLTMDRQARQSLCEKVWTMNGLALDRTAPKRQGGDSVAKAWLRALAATAPIAAHPERTLPALIEELAEIYGDAPALLSDRESLTYRELSE